MVSLEQILALETRVEKAVALIDKLRRENAELERGLSEASRTQEQLQTAYSELVRRAQTSIQSSQETSVKIEELRSKLGTAELRAAEAEERSAAADRKAHAAEAEGISCREKASAAERRSADLESKAEELRKEQERIEEGLSHALSKLDAFEDLVMGISTGTAVPAVEESYTEDKMVKAAEESPQAAESQEAPFTGATFPGTEHELDIY